MRHLSATVAAETGLPAVGVSLECVHSDVAELAAAETERSTVLLALIVYEAIVDSSSVECPVVAAAGTEMTKCSLAANISSEYQHLAELMMSRLRMTLSSNQRHYLILKNQYFAVTAAEALMELNSVAVKAAECSTLYCSSCSMDLIE